MGFFRGLGKLFGSLAFTTFLVLAILIMELVGFTSYESFKLIASEILGKQFLSVIPEEDLDDLQSFLLFQCSQTDRVNVPILGGQPVLLKCADVRNADKSQLRTLITTAFIDSLYYKDFDCSFLDCIRTGDPQNLLVVVSNEGNLFYKSLQTYMWIGTGVGLLILLLSAETWVGRLKGVGFNLVFTGLPFLLFKYIQPLIMPSLPLEADISLRVVDPMISSLENEFIIILVIGIVSVVAGYGLGFYLSRKEKK